MLLPTPAPHVKTAPTLAALLQVPRTQPVLASLR
jgi:hypothetical protein